MYIVFKFLIYAFEAKKGKIKNENISRTVQSSLETNLGEDVMDVVKEETQRVVTSYTFVKPVRLISLYSS